MNINDFTPDDFFSASLAPLSRHGHNNVVYLYLYFPTAESLEGGNWCYIVAFFFGADGLGFKGGTHINIFRMNYSQLFCLHQKRPAFQLQIIAERRFF